MSSLPGAEAGAASENRYLIEILTWDWSLYVGMEPKPMPDEAGFQGQLMYARGVDIRGRVVAPRIYRGKSIGVSLSPIGKEILFGPDGLGGVGQLIAYEEPLGGREFGASVLLPEDALPSVITCLASAWKYIHIWTTGSLPNASVSAASFSRDVHENLLDWMEQD